MQSGSRRVAYEDTRLELARYRLDGRPRERVALHALELGARALGADRFGLWRLSPERDALSVIVETTASAPGVLALAGAEPYVEALERSRVLVVDDIEAHPAMGALGPHLLARGSRASLEAPILSDGAIIGVVRAEQATVRSWSAADAELVSAVSDTLMLICERAGRAELEAALQLREQTTSEAQKLEALGRMARSVAHDFTNVLNLAAIALELLAAGMDDEGHDLLRQSLDTGKQLTRQLAALATEERVPEGACELGEVIEEFMPLLRVAAGSHAQLAFRATSDAPVPITATEAHQILLNLVLNARDALAGDGAIELVLRAATPADAAPRGSIVLAVVDTGAGMDDATRSRVFESSFTTKPNGTGVGMSTVFWIVHRAGGRVHIDSAPGAGTAVKVVLPRAR